VDLQRDDEIGLLAREFNQLVSAVGSYTEDMEAEVERRTREVRDLEQENSRLRLVEERERIYRDLHDSLGAQLTNISICATVARNSPGAGESRMTEMIDRIDENARVAIEGLRETILGEPDFSSFPGIVDRIEQMAERRLSLKGITLTFDHQTIGQGPPVPPEVGESLYRVCEELITNVQKHSQAAAVSCRIARERDRIRLKCSDDGVGFDLDEDHRGFGLKNMAQRVDATGGVIGVTTGDTGTTITCEFPLFKDGQ
jgi:signal transduction histidine kinase